MISYTENLTDPKAKQKKEQKQASGGGLVSHIKAVGHAVASAGKAAGNAVLNAIGTTVASAEFQALTFLAVCASGAIVGGRTLMYTGPDGALLGAVAGCSGDMILYGATGQRVGENEGGFEIP